jgi:hypothetical protein
MFGEIKSYNQSQIMQDLQSRVQSNTNFAKFTVFRTSNPRVARLGTMEEKNRGGWCFGICVQLLSKVESFVQQGGDTNEASYIKTFCQYIDCLMPVGALKLQSLQAALGQDAGQYTTRAVWGFHWREKPGLFGYMTGTKEEEHGHAIIVDFTLKNLVLVFDPNYGLFGFDWHGIEPLGPEIVANFANFKRYCAREDVYRINVYTPGESAVIGATAASRV